MQPYIPKNLGESIYELEKLLNQAINYIINL